MFPLFTKTFPASADELSARLSESLSRLFALPAGAVAVRARRYPQLEELAISLDGATVRPDPPRPVFPERIGGEVLDVERFSLRGRGVAIGEARGDLSVSAAAARFQAGTASGGDVVLVLSGARDGRIEVTGTKRDLESLIATVAATQARQHGVTVENVRLELQQEGERSVAAVVHVRARKLFLGASVRIAGRLEIDDQMNAQLSGLRCDGEGAVAAVACGLLRPHLERLNRRQFSLVALPLGDLRLRDVRLAVGDSIAVTAAFDSAS